MVDVSNRPSITIDGDPADERFVRRLDAAIWENPEGALAALNSLGSLATQGSLKIYELDKRTATLARSDFPKMFKSLFVNRYDWGIIFDDDTENALKEDPDHKVLMEAQLKARSYTVKRTSMSSELRHDVSADEARDAVRLNRMIFYLNRVADYIQKEADLEAAS